MGASTAYTILSERGIGRVSHNEPMSRHTTFRIGGPATAFVECDTIGELANAIEVAQDCDSPWTIIGKGSNILVSDRGYDGVAISLGGTFRKFELISRDSDDGTIDTMVCGAGMVLGRLVEEAFRRGYSGFEFGVGIPGTLGGAVYMNAGTSEGTIGQVIRSVVVYRPGEGLHRYLRDDLPWIYRYSGIPAGEVVVEAEINLVPSVKFYMQARMEDSLKRRRNSQPSGFPNAGSIFRNPVGASAGKLIEDAGFKGRRFGGAQVSDMHANFIINLGNATAEDVLVLITDIRKKVKELYGIELQPETKFLGFRS
ncbi:MAG: UDP-N-acetylmuramate dehydrogenase [Coriobacteriales bacterium]|jgi:UDP-N-acetylmuramate dehydrogenase